MKSLIFFVLVVCGVFIAAVASPDLGFYLFIGVFAALLIFKFGKRNSAKDSLEAGPDPSEGWKLGRIGKAVKAVRKKEMTVAQASVHFNVTEKSIRALHYLDTY